MSAFSPPQGGWRSSVVLGFQPSQRLKPASGRDTSLPVYRKNGLIAHLQRVFPDATYCGCTEANGNQQHVSRCCTSLEPWRAGEGEGLGVNKGLFLTHRQALGDSSSPIFFRLCCQRGLEQSAKLSLLSQQRITPTIGHHLSSSNHLKETQANLGPVPPPLIR